MEEKSENVKKIVLDSTITIAIVTGLIYVFSFIYLKGFLSYYKIPTDYNIEWSLFLLTRNILSLGKYFTGIIIKALISGFLILFFIKKNVLQLWLFFVSLLISAFLFGILASFINNVKVSQLLKIIGYAIIIFQYLGLIKLFIFQFKKTEKDWDKISNFLESPTTKISFVGLLVSLLVILSFCVSKIGFYDAKNKNEYLFYESKSSVLIIQDDSKSIFLKINEQGESEDIFFTTSDKEIEYKKYNGVVLEK